MLKIDKKRNKKNWWNILKKVVDMNEFPVFVVLVVITTIWLIISPLLRNISALLDLCREISPNIITVIGIGMLMIGGEFDLTVGSLLAVVGVSTAVLFNYTNNIYLSIGISLLSGILIGLFNSFLVNRLKVNSLIATLAMMFALRGLVYVYTGKVAIATSGLPNGFKSLYYGSIGGIPIPFLVAIILLTFFHFVMTRTSYGRNIFAIGGNYNAALAAGISIRKIKLTLFIICSLLSSISAILIVAQTSTGFFDVGSTGWELTAITACVLGGLSLGGGEGSLFAAVLGMFILGLTNKGLRLMGVYTTFVLVVNGLIMIFSLYAYQLKKMTLTYKKFN